MKAGRRRRSLLAWVLTLIAMIMVPASWFLYSFTKQVDAWIVLDFYSRQLQRDHAETGHYPSTFEVQDRRGRSVAYYHDDSNYVLVSFGSDGVPDRPDYAVLLGSDVPRVRHFNCWHPAADTVIVNGLMWQGCIE